jgi:uncharacterized protein (DUF58 family)
LIASIHKKINKWLQHRIKTRTFKQKTSKINVDEILILPSGFGFACSAVIITIAIGAINYQVNTAFLLVFLGVGLGILCIWETHKNLKGLSIQCLPIEDVQAGQPAQVALLIQAKESARFSIEFSLQAGESVKLERLSKEDVTLVLAIPTKHRGHFQLPIIKIYTFFPLGIVHAWSYLFFDRDFYVYPQPVPPGYWPKPNEDLNKPDQSIHQIGDDDLYELKSVKNPWVQSGRIAWKVSARGQGWFLKIMTSPIGENWIFRIEDLALGDIELNLQQLSYWIQTAEEQGHLYGLELNGELTEMNHGAHHMKICLRRLATY